MWYLKNYFPGLLKLTLDFSLSRYMKWFLKIEILSYCLLGIFLLWHRASPFYHCSQLINSGCFWFFWLCVGIEWSSSSEKREHMGLVTLCTPTIELLWHWRWLKKLEVALKHGISVLPFFPPPLYSHRCQECIRPVISCAQNPPSFCSSKLCVL